MTATTPLNTLLLPASASKYFEYPIDAEGITGLLDIARRIHADELRQTEAAEQAANNKQTAITECLLEQAKQTIPAGLQVYIFDYYTERYDGSTTLIVWLYIYDLAPIRLTYHADVTSSTAHLITSPDNYAKHRRPRIQVCRWDIDPDGDICRLEEGPENDDILDALLKAQEIGDTLPAAQAALQRHQQQQPSAEATPAKQTPAERLAQALVDFMQEYKAQP